MRAIRVTADRVGVLIGKSGKTKRMLQKISGMPIDISEDGLVILHDEKVEDPLIPLKISDVVKAIGRGFNPEKALRLMEDDEYLEIINLKEFIADKQMTRIRGRLIGSEGKTKRIIEDLTLCDMIIYGNTVGLIGSSIGLPVAKHAIEMILNGSEHASVYHYLESQRPRLKIAEMGFDI